MAVRGMPRLVLAKSDLGGSIASLSNDRYWKYYGAALLHRTTRAISLTDEGRLTGLQIVYPATQAQPKRVRLLIDKIAEAFSSSGP